MATETTETNEVTTDSKADEVTKGKLLKIPTALLKINHKQNTQPFDEAKAERYADSYEQVGQLQPIAVAENGDKYEVVYGFHRAAAAVIYNKRHPETPMKVQAILSNHDDVDRYIRSAIENAQRKNASPVVIAEQQRHIMEHFGKSAEETAKMFGMDVDSLHILAKLLKLPQKLKDLVTKRELPVVAAAELAGVDREEQERILGVAKRKASGKIKGEDVRKAVKESKRKKAAKNGKDDDSGSVPRSAKEVVAFFEDFTAQNEQENVRAVARAIIKFKDGKISQEKAARIFASLGGLIELPPEPDAKPIDEALGKKKPAKKEKAEAAA